jgi:MFS family permease
LTSANLKEMVPRPVALVSAAVALSLLGDSLLYAVLPSQAEGIGVPIELVGVLLSVNRFIRLLSNSWAGSVCARLGYARPFTAALLLGAATTAVYGVVSGFWLLFVARVLWGVSWSFLRVGGLGTVIQHASDHDRGLLMGFFLGISRLGSLVAVALGGLLTDALGYRPTLLLFAALSAMAAAISAPAGGRTGSSSQAQHSHRRPEQYGIIGPPLERPLLDAGDMVIRHRLQAVYACGFAHGFVMSGVITATLGLLLKTLYGSSITVRGVSLGIATITGLLLSSRWLIDFGLGPYLGHVSDRLGRHRVILAALLTGALALIVFASVSELAPLSLGTVAIFASGTALSAALDASLGDLARPGQQARIIGRYTTCQDLGSACGPLLGYAFGVWLGLGVMYGLGVCLLVAAAGLYGYTFVSGRKTENKTVMRTE